MTTAKPSGFVFVSCLCGRTMLKDRAPEADQPWPRCRKCLNGPPDFSAVGISWDARWLASLTGFVAFFVIVAILLSGCASQTGLYNPATERVCSDRICWIRADAELVNRRCTDRKSAWKKCQDDPLRKDCAGVPMRWDDGITDPGKRARCCTVLRPKPDRAGVRYWIWMAEGEEECGPHEIGHIEVYEADGQRYVPESHNRLHGYGLGREKKRI